MMDVVALRAIHRKQPFKPYRIRTSSGESYRVPHPEALMTLGNEQAVAVSEGAADFNIIALSGITEVTPLYPGTSAPELAD